MDNVTDDVVYGGITADTQHQQQRVRVAVQKIVACSTTGGYVPQYNHKASVTGCLTKTHFIAQLYTIMVSCICCNIIIIIVVIGHEHCP